MIIIYDIKQVMEHGIGKAYHNKASTGLVEGFSPIQDVKSPNSQVCNEFNTLSSCVGNK